MKLVGHILCRVGLHRWAPHMFTKPQAEREIIDCYFITCERCGRTKPYTAMW